MHTWNVLFLSVISAKLSIFVWFYIFWNTFLKSEQTQHIFYMPSNRPNPDLQDRLTHPPAAAACRHVLPRLSGVSIWKPADRTESLLRGHIMLYLRPVEEWKYGKEGCRAWKRKVPQHPDADSHSIRPQEGKNDMGERSPKNRQCERKRGRMLVQDKQRRCT